MIQIRTLKAIGVGLILLLPVFGSSQGSSCSAPYQLQLDGVSRNYTSSAVPGLALHCTDPTFIGIGFVTVFSFTTNSTGSCALLDLATSGGQPAEILLYSKCSGGGALQNLEASSSVCFPDGTGLWAPSETLDLEPNQTYFLRVWTKLSCSIRFAARSYDPPNSNCIGATTITPNPISDNNACAKPSVEVEPMHLCAFSLENTAFYKYTTEYTGVSVLMINAITCDNSAAGAVAGFQIGFFTGSCGSLVPVNCYSATGGNVSAPTNSMPAGTEIYVAIDGMSGSNCSYNISAFNAVVVSATLKYFTAWKSSNTNILRWQVDTELPGVSYEIEKSQDGNFFHRIGAVPGTSASGMPKDYSFSDNDILPSQYYRVKIVAQGVRPTYSNIIHLKREDDPSLVLNNPVTDQVRIRLLNGAQGIYPVSIVDEMGRVVSKQIINLSHGENAININVSHLPKGMYYVVMANTENGMGQRFIKM